MSIALGNQFSAFSVEDFIKENIQATESIGDSVSEAGESNDLLELYRECYLEALEEQSKEVVAK